MKPFSVLESVACPLPVANVDTDQIIPARFMKQPREEGGYGRFLLHDMRFDETGAPRADFPLNEARYAHAGVIIARANFGCGSSREPAVYALADYGVGCVIAPSFGDIFASNAVRNGLLPASVSEADAERLLDCAHVLSGAPVRIDLAEQTVTAGNLRVDFQIAPQWKSRMLNGWDDVDLTLSEVEHIAQFSLDYEAANPWANPWANASAKTWRN